MPFANQKDQMKQPASDSAAFLLYNLYLSCKDKTET